MPDYGAAITDEAIREMQGRLEKTYGIARKELEKKLEDFNRRHANRDAMKRKQLAEGRISKQQYADWQAGQVFQREQWEEKVKEVTVVMTQSNEQALKMIEEGRLDVFTENYNYSAYLGEQKLGISFGVYNTQSVARLIKDDPRVLPQWKIDQPKDYAWNAKKVGNIVQQGIIQGEGIRDITKRLCSDLSTQNENKMQMFARTMMTEAQNAGRQKQMEDAADMGIEVHKQWLATPDSRTRDAHRDLDGQEVPVDKDFESKLGAIAYPGDSSADPANVYNCRCTMVSIYPKYEDRTKRNYREDLTIDGQSYEQWKGEESYQRWLEQKQQFMQKQPEQKKEDSYNDIIKHIKEIRAAHSGDWNLDELQQLGTEVAKAAESRQAELNKKIAELKEKVDNPAHYDTEWMDNYDKYLALRREKSAFASVLKDIRECGGINSKTIKQYGDFTIYKNKASQVKKNVMEAMNRYPKEWLEASKQFRITLKPHWSSARAYYSPSDGEIRVREFLSTNVHELGHRFESTVKGIIESEREFYKKRTQGENLVWLGRGYAPSEKTRRDQFINEYMGKDYGGNAYELVSMGFQYAFTDYDKLAQDKDMQTWILGILAGL